MATPETQPVKSAPTPAKKPNFSGFLRAVDVDRLNAANNADKPLFTSRKSYAAHDAFNARLLQATGMIVSAIWLVGAAVYIQRSVGWNNVSGLLPHEMGGFLAGILSPIALFWMVAAFIMRSNDVKKYAEALREEIQVMIFPSDEADRRVNNDIERLIRQTAEMSKATRMALGAIESAREGLRTQVNVLNDSSELTVDRLDALSQALNTRMSDAAEVGKKLDATLQAMEDRAVVASTRMETSREYLDQTVAKIDDSSKSAEVSINSLSDMLRERLDALGSLHEETETALQNASTEMANQRKELRNEAEAIEEKAYQITDALQKATGKMFEFSDDALDKSRLIESRLQGQTESLQKILNQTTENAQQIETATSEAVAKLQNITEKTMSDSNQIENVLQNAISRLETRAQSSVEQVQDSMGKVTDKLVTDLDQMNERAKEMTDTMLGEVNRKVVDTTSAFAFIQKQIQALVTLFDERKMHLDDASMSARETAATMSQTLQLALNKVAETTDALQKGVGNIQVAMQQPITLLENVAKMAYQRADDIGQLLQNKAVDLTNTAERMGEHVANIQHQLNNKGQDVALIAGKIASHLKSVTQELENQNELLDGRLSQSVQSLETMKQANQDVVDTLGKLQEQTMQTTEQSAISADAIQQRVSLLQQLQKALADNSEQSNDAIARVSERLVTISANAVEKIKNTVENMTLLEADYHRLSDAGVEDIQRLETGYRQMLENVRQETVLTNTTLSAHLSVLENTSDSFATQAAHIQELGQSATTTLQQVSSLSQGFDTRVTESGRTISVHINSINQAMGEIQSRTMNAVEALLQQEHSLEQHVQTHIDKLSEANQHFITSTEGMHQSMTKAVETMQKIREEGDATEQSVGQSVAKLLSYNEQIDQSTNSLLEKISDVQQGLTQQSGDLQTANEDILARLQQATSTLSSNAAALEAAAKAAQKQAEELRSQEAKLKRDAFFNSTKFVVESLHSLALDFTRMLEGELHDKTWRAYQKGDVASFTRRLLSARDAETQAKIETKFKDDVEFRTYVQRYLRQFEEIYDAAVANDHADLLATIFSTSDVGRLYQFLCATLDREPRGAKKIA